MRPIGAVFWLLFGQFETAIDHRQIEVDEERPVDEDIARLSILGVAGELATVQGEIRVALNLDAGCWMLDGPGNCRAVAFHDEAIRGGQI